MIWKRGHILILIEICLTFFKFNFNNICCIFLSYPHHFSLDGLEYRLSLFFIITLIKMLIIKKVVPLDIDEDFIPIFSAEFSSLKQFFFHSGFIFLW